MRFAIISLGVALAAAASPALAQDGDNKGVYLSLNAGVATVSDVRLTYFDQGGTFGGTGAQDTIDFTGDVSSAFAFGGTIGYDFGLIRTDLQIDYSRSKVKSLTLRQVNGQNVTLTPADGADICDYLETENCTVNGNTIGGDGMKLRQLSALANIWVDIPTGGRVTPYVGGGAGIGGYEVGGEGKARFAWQLGAGLAVDLSRNIALTIDYRHRQISGARIVDEDFPSAGLNIGKVKTNTFSAGLRFNL
ncbi:outer membrane protein [Sphingomonas sp. TX0543]|uniref:outer membrane protein n=1 Tax=unclassified Sphingomonas TaxID=196159 RepID=UPI0010F7EF44|nr:outer membrane beta-barrel protein [Sphingomonas sp. 3P27F8]